MDEISLNPSELDEVDEDDEELELLLELDELDEELELDDLPKPSSKYIILGLAGGGVPFQFTEPATPEAWSCIKLIFPLLAKVNPCATWFANE